ncbi:glycosyltransferase family 2 protein [Collinsella tanakaei]|uniref:glycosyltransferase family 2 protein n=1 Tax=Collinsella tanakaei TaxID=626935 RepID=UPI001956E3F7|nr:glycosyltransferase family 2 protein [Collinsella tanakaei]MBM6868066.1 glycosyltransferase family 2 protein [Collinsella tanakaei]
MKILAVIPAYNEEACIVDTVEWLRRECPDISYLVVNDGSKDATADLCRAHGFSYVSLSINTRLTSAFRCGMKYAWRHGFDAVVQFDADGQHLPSYIPKLAAAMEEHDADIVIASRFLDGTKPTGARGVGQRLITALIKLTTGMTITDPTSGMRMFNRSMIEHFAKDFDIAPEPDTVALMARKGKTIVEIPAKMQERQGGTSYLDLPHIVSYMGRTCLSILLFQWLR